MNRKVLILCHDFPPLNTVGGMRPFTWFNEAKRLGYDPVVICAQPPRHLPQGEPFETNESGTIIRVDTKLKNAPALLRKANTFVNLFTQHITILFDTKRDIYHAARKYLATNPVDVIVACGEPFVLFRYAYKLSRRFNIPWVADYRDGWTTNHMPSHKPLAKILRAWNRIFEKRYLKSAVFYSCVSKPIVTRIREELCPTAKGYEIRNGVDLAVFNNHKQPYRHDGTFRLVYTGLVYNQPYINVFIEGFKLFADEVKPENFELNFYGMEYQKNDAYFRIKALADQYPQYIRLLPRVSLAEALKLQCEATVLLSFVAGSHALGLYGTKTYEYYATGRPTLAVPSIPDKRTDLFPDKNYQVFAIDPPEVAQALKEYYEEHRRGNHLSTGITEEETYRISRQYSTELLFGYIDEALRNKLR